LIQNDIKKIHQKIPSLLHFLSKFLIIYLASSSVDYIKNLIYLHPEGKKNSKKEIGKRNAMFLFIQKLWIFLFIFFVLFFFAFSSRLIKFIKRNA
jgi:hypothetical protein